MFKGVFKSLFCDQMTNMQICPLSTCHIAAFQRFKMIKAWTSVTHSACHHLKPLFKCLRHILLKMTEILCLHKLIGKMLIANTRELFSGIWHCSLFLTSSALENVVLNSCMLLFFGFPIWVL